MKTDINYSSKWVQSSLQQCEHLEEAQAVTPDAAIMVRFAIRWAPFGGPSAEDLLVAFGVGRQRFMQLLAESLQPLHGDSQETRRLKGILLVALTSALQLGVTSTAGRPLRV